MLGTRARSGDRYLTIIVISLDSFALAAQLSGRRGRLGAMRVAVRGGCGRRPAATPYSAHCGDTGVPGGLCSPPRPWSPLTEQWGQDQRRGRALTASIGCATALDPALSQSPEEVVDQLSSWPTEAVETVRRSGKRHSTRPCAATGVPAERRRIRGRQPGGVSLARAPTPSPAVRERPIGIAPASSNCPPGGASANISSSALTRRCGAPGLMSMVRPPGCRPAVPMPPRPRSAAASRHRARPAGRPAAG